MRFLTSRGDLEESGVKVSYKIKWFSDSRKVREFTGIVSGFSRNVPGVPRIRTTHLGQRGDKEALNGPTLSTPRAHEDRKLRG